jgi:hypothetical protein
LDLTDQELAFLAHLSKLKNAVGPGYIGSTIYGGLYGRKPQAYAMTGGKVLDSLRQKGLVRLEYGRDWKRGTLSILGWKISVGGKEEASRHSEKIDAWAFWPGTLVTLSEKGLKEIGGKIKIVLVPEFFYPPIGLVRPGVDGNDVPVVWRHSDGIVRPYKAEMLEKFK